jgi:hypothetical protein
MVISSVPVGAAVQPHNEFELVVEPHWRNLEQKTVASAQRFGGKWILIGSITLNKKGKEHVDFNKLYLRWQGPQLDSLFGSLYRKHPHKEFLPIQENLVCDGTWSKNQQTLKLTFEQTHTLRPTNTFYLVLTVPEGIEPVIKKGRFEIVQNTLPEPYRTTHTADQLLLSLDAVAATTTEKP